VQASFLVAIVCGFLVIKGELHRPMPSALPVRLRPHAAVRALLLMLN